MKAPDLRARLDALEPHIRERLPDVRRRLTSLEPALRARVPDVRRSLQELEPELRARVVGPAARFADRFGMWLMLRSHYGRGYRIAPTQLTQVDVAPYLALSLEKDRVRLFPAPRPPERVSVHPVAALLDFPDERPIWVPRGLEPGGSGVPMERHDFAFPSPHVPLTPDFAKQYESVPENRLVHGRIYSARGSRPTRAVIAVHGFADANLDSVARFTPAERMAARDAAMVAVALPYHGPRMPPKAIFSGELFMSGDVVRTFEAVLQAVSDIRATVAWLREARGIEQVGLLGGSLGGYVATLTASVDSNLAFLYAIAPPIRITDSIDTVPLGRYMRAGLDYQGIEREVLHALQDMLDPSCHRPALPTHRMRFVAGHNDLFVPHTHMRRLIESWEGLRVHWHDWGHLTFAIALSPRRLFDELEEFADEIGF